MMDQLLRHLGNGLTTMNEILQHLGNGLSQIASIAVVVACAVLWQRRRGGWVLLALIGQIGVFACHLALVLSPTAFANMPFLRVLWPINACIFAMGFLGYAWFETPAHTSEATRGGTGVAQ